MTLKNKILVILNLTLIILTILISGERTSFLIIFTCFVIFYYFKILKNYLFLSLTLIIFILIIYSSNNFLKIEQMIHCK